MAKSQSVAPELSVQLDGLKDLQKALKAAADGTDKRLKTGLKNAGNIAAKQAKEEASWSSKIGKSIKVSVTQKQVAIVAGGPKAPEAISYEVHGKHPVYAREKDRKKWAWNKKPLKRPFLVPAVNTKVNEVAEAILDAIGDISQD